MPYKEKNKIHLKLNALESALIVYEQGKIDLPEYKFRNVSGKSTALNTTWNVKFEHIDGTEFKRKMMQLIDFKLSDDELLKTFAGTILYTTTIEKSGNLKYIKLNEVNEAVTELFVNGKSAGMQ